MTSLRELQFLGVTVIGEQVLIIVAFFAGVSSRDVLLAVNEVRLNGVPLRKTEYEAYDGNESCLSPTIRDNFPTWKESTLLLYSPHIVLKVQYREEFTTMQPGRLTADSTIVVI